MIDWGDVWNPTIGNELAAAAIFGPFQPASLFVKVCP
jgi:hypothetical protein